MGTNGRSGEDARQTVELVTGSGSTDLGTPFPHGENADGSFHLFSGSAEVVITDDNGHVRFIAFGEPGNVRSLRTFRGGAATASLGCSGMTSTSLACAAFDEETTTLMRIGLDRSGSVDATPDCVGAPAALRTAIAWVGCRNRLQVLRADGSVRMSTTAFGGARPLSAFGAVVLQSKDGRSLQSMTRAGSTPRTVEAAIRQVQQSGPTARAPSTTRTRNPRRSIGIVGRGGRGTGQHRKGGPQWSARVPQHSSRRPRRRLGQ